MSYRELNINIRILAISIGLHVLLLLFLYSQTVVVKLPKVDKHDQRQLIQSYITPAPSKRALVVKPVIKNVKKPIKTALSAVTKPTQVIHKNSKMQYVAAKEESVAENKTPVKPLRVPIIVDKKTDSLSQPKNSTTLAQQFRTELKKHLRKNPPLNRSSNQSLSVMVPKKITPIEFETWQLPPIKEQKIRDIEPDGARQLYGERLTAVNGTCYKITQNDATDALSLGGERWTPTSMGCGLKDKVKQQLDASLNKFIGYRKNKGVFHFITIKFETIINAIKLATRINLNQSSESAIYQQLSVIGLLPSNNNDYRDFSVRLSYFYTPSYFKVYHRAQVELDN